MTSSDASTEIRVALLGEWMPSQLADLLALQRAEEPENVATLVECIALEPTSASSSRRFDFAVSPNELKWPGWVCEPLWHDTLSVAVAKRSHFLVHREMPRHELLTQPVICAQSTADESWHAVVHDLLEEAPQVSAQTVSNFDVAMTLVAAGYGIAIAPTARLAGYACRGIATRRLAGTPTIVMAYLLYPSTELPEPRERFACRARCVS